MHNGLIGHTGLRKGVTGMDKQAQWTNPYCGVQHLHGARDGVWATTHDLGECCELLCWYPGCGFGPHAFTLESASDARDAGERYVLNGLLPTTQQVAA